MKIKYKAGYKYQLAETTKISTAIHPPQDVNSGYIRLTSEGLLIVVAGYAWDGPSGPTIDTKTFMRGSLFHDALYQLLREGKLIIPGGRKLADKLLRAICLEDGMWKIRAWWVYRAVRTFSKQSSIHGRKIQEAP